MVELDEMVAEWYPSAYRTARLIVGNASDAEEAVQDALLRAWRFRTSMWGDSWGPWLSRVLVNACYSKLRSEARHRKLTSEDDAPEEATVTDATVDSVAAIEAGRTVRAALAELPDHLRVVVVLRYFLGLSEREIATAIRRRPGTVKSRLFEARQRLAADTRLAGLRREEAQ
jgi:RNA polymerase sigma-70 factor (ECF subfamily)